MQRRAILKSAAAFTALPFLKNIEKIDLAKSSFRIGACDWSIGKSSDLGAFEFAKQIGLQGVQVNLGSDKDGLHLRRDDVQAAFKSVSKIMNKPITSLAIGELNQVPYKSEPRTEGWVSDSIDVAKAFGVKVVLLAFFVKNDLRNDEKGKATVIERLKKVAPKAEKLGITLGIESYLTAEEHLDIMEKVGSNAIKVYYDPRNAQDAGNDIYKEIKLLGSKNICEIHIKDNDKLLGTSDIDWRKVRKTLESIDYVGDKWLQIEWSVPKGADLAESYAHNFKFMQAVFGA
jgi:L-ribulose-5-phosphate 3-epimerase